MRILDQNDIEIFDPDLNLGYLKEEEIVKEHHPAVEAIQEVWHYETIREYPNGGKDVEKVIDVPGVEAAEAYDEMETIYRYTLYTAEQLQEMERIRNTPTLEERTAALEAALLEMMGVSIDG